MTLKTSILSGSDWSEGSILYAVDLVETNAWNYITSFFGDYSKTSYYNGTYNNTSITLTRGVPYRFKSFTLSSATVSTDSTAGNEGKPVIILVDGNVAISGGTIDLKGKGYAGGAQQANGASGVNGSSFSWLAKGAGHGLLGQSETAGSQGGAAGTFTYLDAADQPDAIYNFMNAIAGAGGASGGGVNSGAGDGMKGGAGGNGGGALILLCNGNLNFSGGTIDVRGNDGSAAAANTGYAGSGGGGAGSGGMIVLGCNGTLTNNGTKTVTGGTGGAGGNGETTGVGGGGGGGASGAGGNGTAGANGTGAATYDGGNGGNGGTGLTETFTW